jgi:hypothetical protein
MAGINSYLAAQTDAPAQPGSEEWFKLIGQASVMKPDQAQLQSPMDDYTGAEGRLSTAANMPLPKDEPGGPVPMVQNFTPGQGLNAYLPPATKAADRALLDQYKTQSQGSMNDQKAGIGQLEQMRNDLASKNLPFDWSTVGSFVDMLNGQYGQKTDLHKVGLDARGMTPDQKDDKLIKLQEQIQGAKGNMSKEALQATQQMLGMIHQNDQTNLMAQHYANTERAADTRSTAFADRNTIARETQAGHVGDLFDKDPVIKPQLDRLNQITLDKHTLQMGGTINSTVMNEIATGIASALGGGKGAGLHASEKQELISLGKQFAEKRSYFEDKQYNALSPDNKQFLDNLLQRLESGYGNSISRRADQIRQGRAYPANPLAQKTLDEKHQYYRNYSQQQKAGEEPKDDLHSLSDDDLQKQYNDLISRGK